VNPTDLELLGYSSKWVEYGFLTEELLRDQVQRFHTSDDQNTEHYRYAAFRQIDRRAAFCDLEFEQYIELAASDPDPGMGTSALIDLLQHPGITREQWEALLAHPLVQAHPRLVQKERLRRVLREPDAPLETLERCVAEGTSVIHREMLDLPDLPRSILEALHECGGSKAVRNIAGLRLKSRR
jgi:hypothetical protein